MNRSAILPLVLLSSAVTQSFAPARADEGDKGARPKIQVAVLLDTSSSMSGLIDQARVHLWAVVNKFIDAKLAGKSPLLEVALLEYGAGRLDADQGYTRIVVPLTDDLDRIYEELQTLKTVGRRGGSLENCGQIIDLAARKLGWDNSGNGLQCIFIAGNESFTQGPVDFRQACGTAVKKGITVSAIFCGDYNEGVRLSWEEGAKLADGSYLSINHNRVAKAIHTPQDTELAKLNAELNKTYLAYGTQDRRRNFLSRQRQQDAVAAELAPESIAQRTRFKSSSLYRNESWDIIDGVKNGRIKLAELKEDQLPEVLQKLSLEKREAYVKDLSQRREKLQTQIADLSKQRDRFIAEERKAKPLANEARLDEALIEAVEEQAEKKGVELND